MDSDELKRYFRKRINSVIFHASTPPLERDEETFHKLRVEIKKIKALYELIDFCDKKFPRKKSLKILKEVFNAAGNVRNLHIEERTIAGFGLKASSKEIIFALHKKEDEAIKKFEKVIDKKLLKQIRKNGSETEDFLKKIKENDLNEYYKQAFSKTNKLIKNRFDTYKLHKTRMELKEFLYNLKLRTPSANKLLQNLDKLQELIGSWHDCIFTIEYLDELVTDDQLTKNEVRHLISVRQKVLRRKNLLIPEINQSRIQLKSILRTHIH